MTVGFRFTSAVVAFVLAGTLMGASAQGGQATGAGQQTRTVPAAPWKPQPGGWFNNPYGTIEAKFRIERQVVAAINHARKGSTIRIAVYSFDRVNVAEALIAAHKRGVRVQVLHNDHQYTPAMQMLRRRLGHDRAKRSFDYTCRTGCRSEQGVLHDKIYLFEKTGGAQDVVMTGSANMTGNAGIHQFNDLLIKNDVPALYDTMLALFEQLKRDKTANPAFEFFDLKAFQLWVMPHPRNTIENDPIMDILRPVKCLGATGGTGTEGRTKIRVSMHSWNGVRGTYIARRLRHLFADGCDVKVMWGLAGSSMKRELAFQTPRGVMPRHANGYDLDEDGEVDMYSHQKYLTISGRYGKETDVSYVYTGSSNWTPQGISGDELILRFEGANLVKRWNRNFEFIWTTYSWAVGGSLRTARPTMSQPLATGPYWEND